MPGKKKTASFTDKQLKVIEMAKGLGIPIVMNIPAMESEDRVCMCRDVCDCRGVCGCKSNC
jgi:hypothetical protein